MCFLPGGMKLFSDRGCEIPGQRRTTGHLTSALFSQSGRLQKSSFYPQAARTLVLEPQAQNDGSRAVLAARVAHLKLQKEADWKIALGLEVKKVFSVTALKDSLVQGNLEDALRQIRMLATAISRFEAQPACWALAAEPAADRPLSSRAAKYLASVLRGLHQLVFKVCLERRNLSAALEYTRLLPPSPILFSSLLRECLDRGDYYAVSKAVEARKAAGIPEDALCFTALMKAAARERNPQEVDALFEKAWKAGIHCTSLFNVLIGSHNASRNTKAAFATYEKMLAAGVSLDAITVNQMITAAGIEGDADHIRQLYQQMRALGPRPNSHTFVHLFTAFHESGDNDPDWLFQVFEDMAELGIAQVPQHFVTFLVAAAEAPLSSRQIQQAIARTLAYRGYCSVYSALLGFCLAQGVPERAVDVWRTIQKGQHKIDGYVFTSLFSACAAYKSAELRMVMTDAHHSLISHWRQLKAGGSVSRRSHEGWTRSYNSLLNACGKWGRMGAAERVFDSMKRHGPAPDLISYNTLLAGYAQAGDLDRAFRVFTDLRESSQRPGVCTLQLRPDAATFGSLLHACARAGNPYSAKAVLELMSHSKVLPSTTTYTSLMHACIRDGSPENVKHAFEVYEKMQAEGLQPTAVTYGCLMTASELDGRLDRAFSLYQEACTRGVLPTDECHNILINVCARSNRLEEALELVKAMARAKGNRFQAGALNSLVRALAPEFVQRALRMLSFMRTLGLRVHRDTLVMLVTACSQASLISQAHDLYWELSQEGAGTTRDAGSHLIMALCRAGEPQLALRVYEDMVLAAQNNVAPSLSRHSPAVAVQQPAVEAPDGCNAGARAAESQPPDPKQSGASPAEAHAAGRSKIRRRIVYDTEEPMVRQMAYDVSVEERACRRQQHLPQRRAVIPHARAMAALVQAFAYLGELDRAFMLYNELQRDSVGASAVTLSDRGMWQSLIETACRKKQLPLALKVFDDWKAYCMAQTVMHRFEEDAEAFMPRLSNVTLAFLEACCRAAPEYEWRVYDVCAAMRQQQERRSQARLPRPAKPSHHVAEE